jgi:hypothetical protein
VITREAVVPGSTVLRSTTVCRSAFSRSAAPISEHTRSTYVRSRLPLSRLGVPTQISEMVVSRTAAVTSVVARSRPAATTSATSSPMPCSTIVETPALIMPTLAVLTSTPITVCPSFAKQAAETQPT